MFKTPLLTLLLLGAFFSVQAQTERGNILLGGTTSGGFATGTTNHFNVEFNPQAGYFVAKNLLLGVEFSNRINRGGNINGYAWGTGVFARYYLSSGKVRPYGFAKLGYANAVIERSGEFAQTTRIQQAFAQAGVGVAYFVSPRVAIESNLGYNVGGIYPGSPFINIGASYYFNRNKRK